MAGDLQPGPPPGLLRNAVLNALGLAAPLVVAYFAIPRLTHTLGTDRFGLLTLGWVILGYFSLFDLGLGRALTQVLAAKISRGDTADLSIVTWSSLGAMLGFGVVGAAIAAGITPFLVTRLLVIPMPLQSEAIRSFYFFAASIPIVVATTGFRAVLEADQRFDLINAVRVPLGVFTYAGPVATLSWTTSLVPIAAVLLAGRVLALFAHGGLALRIRPSLGVRPTLTVAALRPILKFGSWMTVTNVVGPIMVSIDRFVIGAIGSVSAVAYYTAPYEAVTKLWLVPTAVAGVLFPVFSSDGSRRHGVVSSVYGRALTWIFAAVAPAVIVVALLARPALASWLGADYATHSTRVLQWLAAGVLANSVAQVPFALIQGRGRPDLTAKLHLVELPIYLVTLAALVTSRGTDGAAAAWTIRCTMDALALFVMARRLVPRLRPRLLTLSSWAAAAAVAIATAAAVPWNLLSRVVGAVFIAVVFSVAAVLVVRREMTSTLGRMSAPRGSPL